MIELLHLITIMIVVLSLPISAQRPIENIKTPKYLELQKKPGKWLELLLQQYYAIKGTSALRFFAQRQLHCNDNKLIS